MQGKTSGGGIGLDVAEDGWIRGVAAHSSDAATPVLMLTARGEEAIGDWAGVRGG